MLLHMVSSYDGVGWVFYCDLNIIKTIFTDNLSAVW